MDGEIKRSHESEEEQAQVGEMDRELLIGTVSRHPNSQTHTRSPLLALADPEPRSRSLFRAASSAEECQRCPDHQGPIRHRLRRRKTPMTRLRTWKGTTRDGSYGAVAAGAGGEGSATVTGDAGVALGLREEGEEGDRQFVGLYWNGRSPRESDEMIAVCSGTKFAPASVSYQAS